MFWNEKEKKIDERLEFSVLKQDLKIEGNINFTGILVIHGEVNGDIIGSEIESSVVIEDKGVVNGNIKSNNLQILGKVLGDIHSLKSINIKNNAQIKGDILYNQISMEVGAILSGKFVPKYNENSEQLKLEYKKLKIPNKNVKNTKSKEE